MNKLHLAIFCILLPFSAIFAQLMQAETTAIPHYKFSKERQAAAEKNLEFRPGRILVKFRNDTFVSILEAPVSQELEILEQIRTRKDVEFAELDRILESQHEPNDPLLQNQWHHEVVGSFQAWEFSQNHPVSIGIVDPPFQMNHPDLAANTVSGWDVIDAVPITASSGAEHSTIQAGLAAAAINNSIGVAGVANCKILPININGAISEIAAAIYWAADNNVRVLSISWTGANSPTINDAALYHKNKTQGIVVMPGVNGTGFLDYANQPHLFCVSMTDAADNSRSRHGNHIDFAAPGFAVYSTTINSAYTFGSGTSYATPLFAGTAAALFSINPLLDQEKLVEILKTTAVDLGAAGWDQFYGWGRINYGAAAASAYQSLARITGIQQQAANLVIESLFIPGANAAISASADLENWSLLPITPAATNHNILSFTVPATNDLRFFRVKYESPAPQNLSAPAKNLP